MNKDSFKLKLLKKVFLAIFFHNNVELLSYPRLSDQKGYTIGKSQINYFRT